MDGLLKKVKMYIEKAGGCCQCLKRESVSVAGKLLSFHVRVQKGKW
jgi:hypothetical protein